jgi:hypothetical protein
LRIETSSWVLARDISTRACYEIWSIPLECASFVRPA